VVSSEIAQQDLSVNVILEWDTQERSRVDLSLWQVPIVILILGFYYTLYFVGEIMTRVSPHFMEKQIVI